MNNSTYSQNTAKLFHTHPDMKQILLADDNLLGDPSFAHINFETVIADSGEITAKYEGVFLHSKRNPLEEAKKVLEKKLTESTQLCILGGFGLGYFCETLLRMRPNTPVIIIEPDIRLFRKALAQRDMTEFIGNNNITFVLGDKAEQIQTPLTLFGCSDIVFIPNRAESRQFGDFFQKVQEYIHQHISRENINKNTLRKFGKTWVRNLLKNMNYFTKYPGIEYFKDMFEGIPSLIIAAGPSLDTILPSLDVLQKHCLIIAVDTASEICLRYGIEPDFLVVVDPQYWNSRHLDRAKLNNTIIISEPSTYPRVFRLLKGLPTYFCSSLFPLGRYLESLLSSTRGELGAGGSVATTAWDFARYLKCSPIFTAGLDLGFPYKTTHFKGGYFEERAHTLSDRFNPAEHLSFVYLHDAHPFLLPAFNGDKVLSDKRMIIYKNWFEAQLRNAPDIDVRCITPESAEIQGVKCSKPEDITNLPQIRNGISSNYHKTTQFFKNFSLPGKEKIIEKIHRLSAELDLLVDSGKKGLALTQKLEKNLEKGLSTSSIIAELDNLDSTIIKTGSSDIAGFLMQPILKDILSTQYIDIKKETVIKNSRSIYSSLCESAEYHKKLLNFFF